MKIKKTTGGITVNAISGTYVVLLAFDADNKSRKGLLGFSIKRNDLTEKEEKWLRGFKRFRFDDDDERFNESTERHPVQGFMWGDYTTKPGHKYQYSIYPNYGTPKELKKGDPVEIKINTEDEDDGKHAIFFNRGVAGSQAYARKFGNKPPNEVGDAAFKWLSRGLEEAMVEYINQAKNKDFQIRAAVYEFSYEPILQEFKKASERGVDVKIVYDRRAKGPYKETEEVAKKVGLLKLMIPRTKNPSYISHNKFIILLKDGKPIQVWTGSTNFTAGGIFGQSNVGHIIRDEKVAQIYLNYWNNISKDPDGGKFRAQNVALTPELNGKPPKGITPMFSPRTSLDTLEWYAKQMDDAVETLGFTAAFGVTKQIANVFHEDKDYLRYILLEKTGNTYNLFYKDPDNRIAIGNVINENEVTGNRLHGWLAEKLTGLNTFVKYLHTKYVFIDPLSDDPIVITGSANFSEASTKNNDENMVIVRGNQRVAQIFLGEFMRLFNHFYFRDVVNRRKKAKGFEGTAYLDHDDSWADKYFVKGSIKEKERKLFAEA